ncbi:MAG: class I SAM-dependent methyltransferase [Acidimicrobiia bacterium]|nr:class I SAM-dependent methyltransferase [Acidimicrobiia bacterium]
MAGYDSSRYALVNRWDPSHLEKIDRLLPLDPGARVLEVGCGRGHLTSRLAARGIDVVGIDANPRAPELAESDRVVHMVAEKLEFRDAEFDVVIAVHSIEHIPPLDAAFSEMARVLKPGGSGFFIYPAEPIMGLFAIPTAVILYKNPFKAREVHCHKLTPRKVREMLEPKGFEETHHEFNFFKSPQFVSVFRRG